MNKKESRISRDQILNKLKTARPKLVAKYGLKSIGLFGSYASETASETSDIDLIVDFETPIGLEFIELTDYLEELLGKKIDVLTLAGVNNIRNSKTIQNIEKSIIYV